MSLKVIVHSASNLPDVDFTGQSDPFVVLSFRGKLWKHFVLLSINAFNFVSYIFPRSYIKLEIQLIKLVIYQYR